VCVGLVFAFALASIFGVAFGISASADFDMACVVLLGWGSELVCETAFVDVLGRAEVHA
jgi:hypothetical protein